MPVGAADLNPAPQTPTPLAEPHSQPASAPTEPPPYGLSAALVDAARHYGHLAARDDSRRVTLHVLALMKAAGEYDPRNADAFMWQFDLLSRLGLLDEARDALQKYTALEPRDDSAALQLLALQLTALQTAEARGALLVDTLKSQPRSRVLRSDVHRRLAEFYRERDERDLAMQQVASALRWMPLNVAARELAYDMFADTDPFQQRVELALQLLTANPGQFDVVWELARLLDEHGMHADAQSWYTFALSTDRAEARDSVRSMRWMDWARSLFDSGQDARALEALERILTRQPRHIPARLLKLAVLRRDKSNTPSTRPAQLAATELLEQLSFDYDARMADAEKNKDMAAAADVAWFRAIWAPDEAKALRMSQLAMTAAAPDGAARRAHGFALLLNYRAKEAAEQLRPLADSDQWAAYGLGQALVADNLRTDAADVLKRGAALRPTGMAHDRIVELLNSLGQTVPPLPAYPKVSAALARYDRRILDFFSRPNDTLRLTLRFVDAAMPPAGPCRVAITLANINPPDSFAVTFGPGLMVQPRVMLSASVSGGNPKQYRNYTEVPMNTRPVLAPGESIERVVSIDVGILREELLSSATTERGIELTALLGPERKYNEYVASLGSVYARAVTITRPALQADAVAIAELVASARTADPRGRVRAAGALGALLATRDRAFTPLPGADAVTSGGVTEALLTLANDAEPNVRAMAVEALRWGRPSARLIGERLSRCITDDSLVVRLMAIRLFAQVQGEAFGRVLADISAADKSPAVRLLAKSYLSPVSAAASPPAATGPAAPSP